MISPVSNCCRVQIVWPFGQVRAQELESAETSGIFKDHMNATISPTTQDLNYQLTYCTTTSPIELKLAPRKFDKII